MEIKEISFATEWDKNLLIFTKKGFLHVVEHQKQKKTIEIDLKEKMDYFSLEQYGVFGNRTRT